MSRPLRRDEMVSQISTGHFCLKKWLQSNECGFVENETTEQKKQKTKQNLSSNITPQSKLFLIWGFGVCLIRATYHSEKMGVRRLVESWCC